MKITEKYLTALKACEGWVIVSDWAKKVGELYPDLLAKADKEALSQAKETTGLNEIAARISSAIARGAYIEDIELDVSERPRRVRFVSSGEHENVIQNEIEEDVAPLRRAEIIRRDLQKINTNEQYRLAEFEVISKQLKQFFGLEFEVDHAQALLNKEEPGVHHPDNLQLLLKVHNGKKHNQNWSRFSIDEQLAYIISAIELQRVIAVKMDIICDDSVLGSILERLKAIY